MKHIIFFGDSLFSRIGKNFLSNIESKTRNCIFHNCAISGIDSRDALVQANVIKNLNADIVCISLEINDCNPSKLDHVSLFEFSENVQTIISLFENSGSKVILFPAPPVFDPSEIAESEEFNKILNTYNDILSSFKSETVFILNSKEIFENLLRQSKNYHENDGLHLNSFGYEILSKELAQLINAF